MQEPVFNNYKEKQNYYRELYSNRGTTLHTSIIIGRNDKILKQGETYYSEKGETRRIKRQARNDRKNK